MVDTDNASQHWDEEADWDGNNHISRATGVHESQWQGSLPHAEWVSEHEAARWLLHMDEELPDDLKHLSLEVSE